MLYPEEGAHSNHSEGCVEIQYQVVLVLLLIKMISGNGQMLKYRLFPFF